MIGQLQGVLAKPFLYLVIYPMDGRFEVPTNLPLCVWVSASTSLYIGMQIPSPKIPGLNTMGKNGIEK